MAWYRYKADWYREGKDGEMEPVDYGYVWSDDEDMKIYTNTDIIVMQRPVEKIDCPPIDWLTSSLYHAEERIKSDMEWQTTLVDAINKHYQKP